MKTPVYHNPIGLTQNQIDPNNEGWRLLLEEEIIDREATKEIQGWVPSTGGWNVYFEHWTGSVSNMCYRTKWPLPKEYLVNENGWITDRRPTEADGDCNGNVWAYSHYSGKAIIISLDLAGHECSTYPWMPTGLKRPEPPQEKTQEEKDNDALLEARKTAPGLSFMEFDAGWNAGIKYARGEK